MAMNSAALVLWLSKGKMSVTRAISSRTRRCPAGGATKLPLPRSRTASPRRLSSLSTRRAVMLDTPCSSAICASEGRGSPGESAPLSILRR